MASPSSDAIRDRLILIERAAYAIEQGAGDAVIFDLRLQLIDPLRESGRATISS